jgi:3'-phosphoadenosine 5'-phosphosulfate sulfotransferase (PAPS reductase)/FAD synthetase
MEDQIQQARDIYDEAVLNFKPKAVVMMLSGGDDSMACYHVAKEAGINFNFVIHGNTRTGIKETTDFVVSEMGRMNERLLIADAGDAYVNYEGRVVIGRS